MSSPAESAAPKKAPGAPLTPYGWDWMQAALYFFGLVGVVAGLAQSTWWMEPKLEKPFQGAPEVATWLQAKTTLHEETRLYVKWTNLAQISVAAALLIGGTLMSGRFAGLRFSMLAAGWLGIVYAVVGSSVYVWYLLRWTSWAGEMPAAATTAGIDLPSAISGWLLALGIGLLGVGKLLFFIVVVGYFGRFDVRAFLADPPAWFYATSVRPSATS